MTRRPRTFRPTSAWSRSFSGSECCRSCHLARIHDRDGHVFRRDRGRANLAAFGGGRRNQGLIQDSGFRGRRSITSSLYFDWVIASDPRRRTPDYIEQLTKPSFTENAGGCA